MQQQLHTRRKLVGQEQTEDGEMRRFAEERMLTRSGKVYGTVMELDGEQVCLCVSTSMCVCVRVCV